MSHFAVMVIGNDPEDQLAPFDENLEVDEYELREVEESYKERMLDYYKEKGFTYSSFDEAYAAHGEDWDGGRCRKDENGVWKEYSTYNPDSRWDWYVLGGRWSGRFIKLKPGHHGLKGYPGTGMNKTGIDQAYKGSIDFDAIKRDAEENARKNYREVASKFGGAIPLLTYTWKELMENSMYKGISVNVRRTLYHEQPGHKLWHDTLSKEGMYDDIDEFQCTEDEYAAKAVAGSFVPYAIILHGEWISRGEMGWWGISKDNVSREEWQEKVWETVQALPDDTLISFYDLHI